MVATTIIEGGETMTQTAAALETNLQNWAKPASDSEEDKCENALRMIREALNKSPVLSKYTIELIPKGSYHNNTNVRLTSDVDIAVRLTNYFWAQYPDDKTKNDFGNVDSSYSFEQYRRDVDQAMIDKFGADNVDLGNKAIEITSNSYRVDADVVPCFEHRRYSNNGSFIKGTEFLTRHTGERVQNYPEQHYTNGVKKNENTARRYKKVVRILKRLKYKMQDEGYAFDSISSFLIESLVWNVPDRLFNNATLTEDARNCLAYLILSTSTDDKCKEWGEVSELLYLFRPFRKFTRLETYNFLVQANKYLFS